MEPTFAVEVRIHIFDSDNGDIEQLSNDIVVAPVELRPVNLSDKKSLVNELERLPQFPKAHHAVYAGIAVGIEDQSPTNRVDPLAVLTEAWFTKKKATLYVGAIPDKVSLQENDQETESRDNSAAEPHSSTNLQLSQYADPPFRTMAARPPPPLVFLPHRGTAATTKHWSKRLQRQIKLSISKLGRLLHLGSRTKQDRLRV